MTSRPSGFTVIELLVSATLAASMMVAVMGVLGMLSTQQREIRKRRPANTELARALSLVKWDLQVGHHIEVADGNVIIIGFGGRDPTGGVPNQRPSQVTYGVWVDQGISYLLRRQAYIDTDEDPISESLLYRGVEQFRILPVNDAGTLALLAGIIPRRLKMVLQMSDGISHDESVFLDKLEYKPSKSALDQLRQGFPNRSGRIDR